MVMTGFEPAKHMHQNLSLTPLTAREHYLVITTGLEPVTSGS